jgi:hypothetical protein
MITTPLFRARGLPAQLPQEQALDGAEQICVARDNVQLAQTPLRSWIGMLLDSIRRDLAMRFLPAPAHGFSIIRSYRFVLV